jgi:hypothetical protein
MKNTGAFGTASAAVAHSDVPCLGENLWGYGKRLRFMVGTMLSRFPGVLRSQLSVLDVG